MSDVPHHWAPEPFEIVLRSNASDYMAAEILGLPVQEVVALRESRRGTSRQQHNRARLPEIVRLYVEGRSIEYITGALGVSKSFLRRALRSAGVPSRTRKGGRRS